jgi:hypothetical protein
MKSVEPEQARLGRNRRIHSWDLALGIVAMTPEPETPLARLAVSDDETGESTLRVVGEGDVFMVGRRRIRILALGQGRDGFVDFEVSFPFAAADDDGDAR